MPIIFIVSKQKNLIAVLILVKFYFLFFLVLFFTILEWRLRTKGKLNSYKKISFRILLINLNIPKMYQKINDSNITKWVVRLLITSNFILSVIYRINHQYFFEGFVLVLIAIWLSWFHKYFIALLFMLLCIFTFYLNM